MRLAWHASGTYDASDSSGGSNGATMRFEPEISDGANAGLLKMQNILEPVKAKFPELSYADLWTLAGVQSVKLMGGPTVPFAFGRSDEADGATCPMNGRLPDAAQGAAHLRDVFYRMGFDDKDIVALSGAHTVGSCHKDRSGFDGPWTSNPVKFDNEYFTNLSDLKWTVREGDGPLQYTDPSGKLMMLPTDMCLLEDEIFAKYVKVYASDEKVFFEDFAAAFGKLIALGCPAGVQPVKA
jgi:catalase (peroxidase I)